MQSLCDWRRSIVQCRTRVKRSAAGVERVLVTPPGGRQRKAAGLPSRRIGPGPGAAEGTSAPVDCRLAAKAALPHACIIRCGWRAFWRWQKTFFFRPLSTRQAELSPLDLRAMGICLTPAAAAANNLWQQQIAGITTLSPGNAAAPGPHPLPDLLLSSLPHRHGVSRRMRDAGLAAGVGFLSGAGDAGFLYQQPAPGAQRRRSSGGNYRLSGTPPRRSCRRSSACVPTAASWMTGCVGESCVTGWGCVRDCG